MSLIDDIVGFLDGARTRAGEGAASRSQAQGDTDSRAAADDAQPRPIHGALRGKSGWSQGRTEAASRAYDPFVVMASRLTGTFFCCSLFLHGVDIGSGGGTPDSRKSPILFWLKSTIPRIL